MNEIEFCTLASQGLAGECWLAQRQEQRAAMSPSMSFGRHFGPPFPTARQAAVMLLVEGSRELPWTAWTIPLTVRPNHLPSHPGQISLPGGRQEGEESLQRTAQRELEEELGVQPFHGQMLGQLMPLYIYNSDFFVTPFLAYSNRGSIYKPCAQEVERVVHLPVGMLIDQSCWRIERFERGVLQWHAPVIRYGQERIWGATAIVLAEFAAFLRLLSVTTASG